MTACTVSGVRATTSSSPPPGPEEPSVGSAVGSSTGGVSTPWSMPKSAQTMTAAVRTRSSIMMNFDLLLIGA